ncbi:MULTISPECIES: hypothetical protein [Sphingobium]|jgi:hypothetical protein|uniref:hypothetical protein n=1 Tax=Sphingobium TaxID=165695 RepID=UPI0003F6E7BA|nr:MULTISPECIES: hypothetical protein [Sphingobium]
MTEAAKYIGLPAPIGRNIVVGDRDGAVSSPYVPPRIARPNACEPRKLPVRSEPTMMLIASPPSSGSGGKGAVLRAKLERSGAPLRTFAEGFFAMIRT